MYFGVKYYKQISWHLLFNKYFNLSNTASEQRVLCHKEKYECKLYIDPHMDVTSLAFPGVSNGKESSCYAGDPDSIPGLGRLPWKRKWQPIPVFCLENSINRGAWRAALRGVAKSRTRLSDKHLCFHFSSFPCL